MSALFTLPGLILVAYVVGYVALALATAKLAREEGFELPPAGLGLVAILMMAWPVLLIWCAVMAPRQRGR